MSISKVHLSRIKPVVAAEEFKAGGDKVTYYSVNDEAGEAFSAATPPNSVHAAKLAQIAMAMQARREQQKSKPKGFLSAISQRLQIQGSAHASTSSSAATAPAPQRYLLSAGGGRDTRRPAEDDDDMSQFTESNMSSMSTMSAMSSMSSSTAYAPVYRQPQAADEEEYDYEYANPAVQPPEVTRYRAEDRTAYKVRGRSGTVKVSAPAGSNEAELFDALAVANSTRLPSNEVCETPQGIDQC